MILLLVNAALACPNCGAPNLGSQNTWLGSSVFLSLVPLLFIGGVLAWIFQRVKAAEAADRLPRPPSAPVEPAAGGATPPPARYTGARSPT